jgi:hypothetical protein
MKQYTITMVKQGQTNLKVLVMAQSQNDAKKQAESKHPGWHVNRIDG